MQLFTYLSSASKKRAESPTCPLKTSCRNSTSAEILSRIEQQRRRAWTRYQFIVTLICRASTLQVCLQPPELCFWLADAVPWRQVLSRPSLCPRPIAWDDRRRFASSIAWLPAACLAAADLACLAAAETTYIFFGRRGSGKTTIRMQVWSLPDFHVVVDEGQSIKSIVWEYHPHQAD